VRQRVREVLDDWASRVFEPDSPRRALPQNPWSRALRNQWSRGALSSSLFDIDDRLSAVTGDADVWVGVRR